VKATDNIETILVASQDRAARAFLGDNLTADGYTVLEAGSLTGALELLDRAPVDLVLVDSRLPDGDGLELAGRIRSADRLRPAVDCDLPIIAVPETSSVLDRIRALDRGCDDCVGRSEIVYAELRARVAALLRRRRRRAAPARLRVGGLTIDVGARQVWAGGTAVRLSNKEFSLLLVLAGDPWRVFQRAELMATVWGWSDGGSTATRTRTLDSHASRLRRKLSRDGTAYVVNVWGVGYRLLEVVPLLTPVEPLPAPQRPPGLTLAA
jgi:DNA-binding response OmpR family regulator